MNKLLRYILFVAVSVLMFACEDLETFSTDSRLLLSFSADTVSFDTVITTVPSSTKRVWIFNNNKEGLRTDWRLFCQ